MQAIGTETMIEIVSDDIFSSSFSSIIEKEMRELKKKRDPAAEGGWKIRKKKKK